MTAVDPQDAILVSLLHGQSKGMTVFQLRMTTGRADSTVRNNLLVMKDYRTDPWVATVADSRPSRWVLTAKGCEVARHRERQGSSR
jgi:hypothetical protein